MIKGVHETALWTLAKIGAMRNLMGETRAYVQAVLPRVYRSELVDLIFQQPYTRINTLVDARIAERQTASNYLRQLAQSGVLVEQKQGREKLFVNGRLLELLTTESNSSRPFPSLGE